MRSSITRRSPEESTAPAPCNGWVPIHGDRTRRRWEGAGTEYDVTVAIPWCNTPDEVILAARLNLLQEGVRVLIVLVDCGSDPADHAEVEAWVNATEDVEMHTLRMLGVKHPSDFPAIAMDLISNRCQTKWMFCTHADVFLKRRDTHREFIELSLSENVPVVGYQISPRPHEGWEGMVSHTATMIDMDVMVKVGLSWNQRRVCLLHGIADHRPESTRENWPDTEIMLNHLLKVNGITPLLVDRDNPIEANRTKNEDHRLFHARSLTSAKLANSQYYREECADYAKIGTDRARATLRSWGSPETAQPVDGMSLPSVKMAATRDRRMMGFEVRPFIPGRPILIWGEGQGGTSAVARVIAAASGWEVGMDADSQNAEGELTRLLGDHDQEGAMAYIKASAAANQGKWIVKYPSLSYHDARCLKGLPWNHIMVTRDPVSRVLTNHRMGGGLMIPVAIRNYRDTFNIAKELDGGLVVVSYENLLTRPKQVIEMVCRWMGAAPDMAAGIAECRPLDDRYWSSVE